MKTKPALWAVVGVPVLFLLLLAGSVRGLSYLSNPSGDGVPVRNGSPENFAPAQPMQPADPKTAAEIKKVAGGQIAAFQKRNYKEALRFAQPIFQKQSTPTQFGEMIESGYNELTTAKTVTLDAPTLSPNGETAQVTLVTKDAQNHETRFLYILSRDAAPPAQSGEKPVGSTWRVSTCVRLPKTPMPPPRLHEA